MATGYFTNYLDHSIEDRNPINSVLHSHMRRYLCPFLSCRSFNLKQWFSEFGGGGAGITIVSDA